VAEAIHTSRSLDSVGPSWRPSSQTAFALRLAVAVSAAIWIGNAPGLADSHPTWILITVLMLIQPTAGASLLKSLLRAIGTVAAALTSILLFGLFSQNPPMLMAGLFIVQVVGAYGYSGTRFQYAWFVWAFTTAVVLGDAMAGQGAVETVAFERASMVGIGILLVFVVDSLVWPARAESSLRESLISRTLVLGETFRRIISTPLDSRSEESADFKTGTGSLASQLTLVGAARSELGASASAVDTLQRLAIRLEALATFARILANPIELPDESDVEERRSFEAASAELGHRIEAALREVAVAIRASRAVAPFMDDLERALHRVESEQKRWVARTGWHTSLEGRVANLRHLVAILQDFAGMHSKVDEEPAAPAGEASLRFRADSFRAKIALRGGIAVLLAFLVMVSLGWPMNTTVAPIAFMISAVPTRGAILKTFTQLVLVLAVSWLVADLLIVYVTPLMGRAPLALLLPFSVAGAFGYAGARYPRLAMLPSIGGLVTLLSLFGATSPPTDVYGSYSMVCYMGLALVIGSLCGRIFWPATAAGLFRERLGEHFSMWQEGIRELATRGGLERRRAEELFRASVEHGASLGSLHDQARREPVERALDEHRRAEILSLATGLTETAFTGPETFVLKHGEQSDVSEASGPRMRALLEALRTEQEALLASMQSLVDVIRGEAVCRASDLATAHQAVEDRAQELRADPTEHPEVHEEQMRRFLVHLDVRRELVLRHQAIEEWLAEWQEAEQNQTTP
jgi:uncharacterized membrane protein YccC